jgi:prephenate dehydrogenase
MTIVSEDDDARAFEAAAGSFRDVTRTAGTNPRIWHDILSTNRAAVGEEIDRMVGALQSMRNALIDGDLDTVDSLISTARAARKKLPIKGERTPAEPITVEVSIPDRPGVIAEVATALGEGGINIEDLAMDHSAAGGMLLITVDGRIAAGKAIALLSGRAFRASVLEQG